MFSRLRRLLASTEPAQKPCQACITKNSEIAWLRQQHDLLLDRTLSVAGQLQATTEALSVPVVEEDDKALPGDEPTTEELEEFDRKAAEEAARWAEENQVPIGATHDV